MIGAVSVASSVFHSSAVRFALISVQRQDYRRGQKTPLGIVTGGEKSTQEGAHPPSRSLSLFIKVGMAGPDNSSGPRPSLLRIPDKYIGKIQFTKRREHKVI